MTPSKFEKTGICLSLIFNLTEIIIGNTFFLYKYALLGSTKVFRFTFKSIYTGVIFSTMTAEIIELAII